ncbi:ABC transporter, ATP-binding protein [Lunatimonas lonarensis]|uniref:ABC transporter, ATP-binding protein n=1 Tax=Lunatimonas lonarensis TaxID=1232681 RepID=R7ZUB3_9BACT|nr:ATP-binding cassette domain-containing protein [Lunatimonas lonarensis]EON77751.1 ABC transporter, ATP-binding protein [Lunatimonas lonarensis]
MYILEISGLNKAYGSHVALRDIDLLVAEGSVFGLLGPNGAGKTTLIRIVNQIIDKDSGVIRINGEPLRKVHVHSIGYLPEERGLYKGMAVDEQLLYFAQLKGLTRKEAKYRIGSWLTRLNLDSWRNKKVQELSKGMAQKVQFIATVIHEPKLLILDEPFSGFDPVNAEIIKNEILALRNNGTTIILSTHRMESVELLCDHIAMINKSRKILDGSVRQIRKESRSNQYRVRIKPYDENVLPEFPTPVWEDDTILYSVDLGEGNVNQLIQHFMAFGEVYHFEELVPSIGEIFIQKIKDGHGE